MTPDHPHYTWLPGILTLYRLSGTSAPCLALCSGHSLMVPWPGRSSQYHSWLLGTALCISHYWIQTPPSPHFLQSEYTSAWYSLSRLQAAGPQEPPVWGTWTQRTFLLFPGLARSCWRCLAECCPRSELASQQQGVLDTLDQAHPPGPGLGRGRGRSGCR